MMKRKTEATRMFIVIVLTALIRPQLLAQHEPYITHDTRPLIMEGPYLVAPTQGGVSIVWKTDTDCHSRIEYGESAALENSAEVFRHGLVPIGTTHSIRLVGLTPGKTYYYKAVSTRVVKMKPYWPEKGLSIESKVSKFTVPDPDNKTVTFGFITDSHGDLDRLGSNLDLVNWKKIDFLAHGGDALSYIEGEEQLFAKFLRPIIERLEHRPFVFARGNHEMRGSFARRLYDYLPTHSGEFYYAFDSGPVHFLVLDSAEDKDDDTNVYAGLNRTEQYREQEFAWLQNHTQTSQRIKEAPFRVILIHAPNWGWVDGESDKWTDLANRAGVDLVIAGHHHRYSWAPAGTDGRNYGVLVVGQDQAANVEASSTQIKVVVSDNSGKVAGEISVQRRNQ